MTMNQKRITNQILIKNDFSLNSTLNYLFNISNMKKLFSYLLISSMVVLSSCTNYDDQFDDLNTQINTLKSQIEGFSSLSSGLTALQGTVASLQSAINNIPVTPATDISGLEASLTSLAAEVTALQTSLASAATAAEVAALTTSLAAVQADLADLLAANNVYSQDLIVNSSSTLAFAESLGDKVGIINGSVVFYVTASMDATKVQAIASKIKTITGNLSYYAASNAIAAVSFDALTGAGDIEFVQAGSYKFPVLASAGNITLGNNYESKVDGAVDFSALTSITSIDTEAITYHSSGASTAALVTVGSVNSDEITLTKVSSVDLKSLVRYPNASLSISIDTAATVDLSALTTTNATTGLQQALALTVNGPDNLTLSTYETGALTTDAVVLTLPKARTAPSTDATKLKEVHLHNLHGDVTFGAAYTKLAIVDIIGAYETTGVAATVAGPRTNDVTISTTGLETLTLAGALGEVKVSSASSLTSVTTSGGMRNFELDGAIDMTALTLGHGPNASSTKKMSNLSVTGATSLTSLTANSINNTSNLVITGNTELATISMSALAALATETFTENVDISGNNLDAESFQLPSATGVTPVVAAKITSASGLNSLKAYLDLAIAATGSSVKVVYDNVEKVTAADGKVYEVNGTNGAAAPTVTYATGKSISHTAGTAFTAINITPDSRTYTVVAERKQTNTMVVENGSVLATGDVITFNGGQGAVTVTNDSSFNGTISDFVSTNADTWVPELTTAISNKLAAAGYAYTLTSANDYGATAQYNIDTFSSTGVAAGTQLSTGGFVVVNGLGASVSFAVATASTVGLATAVVSAVNTGVLSGTYTASVVNTDDVKLVRRVSSSNSAQDIDFTAYPDMSFGAWSNALSTSLAIVASQTIQQIGKSITKGWRITAVNDGAAKQAKLEAGQSFITDNGTLLTMTAIPAAGQFGTTSSTLQVNYADIVAGSSTVATGSAAATIDYTAWM